MRRGTILEVIKHLILEDDDGSQWVRATHAMEALGLNRSTYRRWSKRGHIPSLRTINVPRCKRAPHGEATILLVDELLSAYAQHKYARRWPKRDEEFVEDWYGIRSDEWIAGQLNRTIKSIKVKASELGLNKKETGGMLCTKEIVRLTGISKARINHWLNKNPRLCTRPRAVSRYIIVKPSRLVQGLKQSPKLWDEIEPRRQRYLEQLAERN